MIRWGVAGPGAIAVAFAQAMERVPDGRIVAVASRSSERAAAFAETYGIERAHGDYRSLAEDEDIDVVYVATPQSRHEPDTLAYLRGGKHVLCEKPLALSAVQGERMAAEARARGLFLMEAVWSRFLPAYRVLVDVVGEGAIGDLLSVEADFGFRRDVDPEHRLFDRALGGGALLDLGIYPIQLCSLLLGTPDHVAAAAVLGATGVDEHVAAVLRQPNGTLGIVKAALRVSMPCTARITGTTGTIDLPAFMHCPGSLTVSNALGTREHETPIEGNGLHYEIAEVHRCLEEGRTESAVMPLDESLSLARTMDSVRQQIGLVFPGEEGS